MKSRITILAILLLATSSPIVSMDAPSMQQLARWAARAGRMLIRQIPTANAQAQLNITNDTDPFKNLTKADQRQIILLLSLYDAAKTLPAAAKIINSLAQVNKQLNALINDPAFCLELTKHLAYQFNSTYENVWLALQTECSKRTLLFQEELRKDLRYLCINAKKMGALGTAQSLSKLINKGADLNFIYKNEGPALIVAMYHSNFDLACALIEVGANPLATDVEGNSALEIAQMMQNDQLIKCIEQAIAKQPKK